MHSEGPDFLSPDGFRVFSAVVINSVISDVAPNRLNVLQDCLSPDVYVSVLQEKSVADLVENGQEEGLLVACVLDDRGESSLLRVLLRADPVEVVLDKFVFFHVGEEKRREKVRLRIKKKYPLLIRRMALIIASLGVLGWTAATGALKKKGTLEESPKPERNAKSELIVHSDADVPTGYHVEFRGKHQMVAVRTYPNTNLRPSEPWFKSPWR